MLPVRRTADNWLPDIFNDFFDNRSEERRGGDRGERRERGERQDRGERRNFAPRREQAPAPQADDYKEPVDELY